MKKKRENVIDGEREEARVRASEIKVNTERERVRERERERERERAIKKGETGTSRYTFQSSPGPAPSQLT